VGLVKVFIGIEAGNPSQLRRYRRGLTLEDITGSLEVLRELRLGIDAGFIMFDPELSLEEMLENIRFFRENRLMPHNQWPFRPMVVNEGSRSVTRLREKGLLGEPDANYISYSYSFENEYVGEIARIVDGTSATTRPVFYALKQKSKKYFDDSKQDAETRLAQVYVEENGHIYLDLMEALALNIETASRAQIERIAEASARRALDLARRVGKDVAEGRIVDRDGYVAGELAKIELEPGTTA
jgi:hypothetical protein